MKKYMYFIYIYAIIIYKIYKKRLYMNIIEESELKGVEKEFFALITEKDLYNRIDINIKKLVNFLLNNPDFYIDKLYIKNNKKMSLRRIVINPLGCILNNADNSQREYFKILIELLSKKTSESLFLVNKKEMTINNEKLHIRNTDIFNPLSNILINSHSQSKEENSEKTHFFIYCFNTLFNNEIKKSTVDAQQLIKNNYFYELDNKDKNCTNFFNVIDNISMNDTYKKNIYLNIYSNFYNKYFDRHPSYPNNFIVDKNKFKKIIKNSGLFNWKDLPSVQGSSEKFSDNFTGSLYMQNPRELEAFFKEHKVNKKDIEIENNSLILQEIRKCILSNNPNKIIEKEIIKIKNILLNNFKLDVFEKRYKSNLQNLLKKDFTSVVGKEKETFENILFYYEKILPDLEKKCLMTVIKTSEPLPVIKKRL